MDMMTNPATDGPPATDASGILLALVLAEIGAAATDAQARGFHHAVGRRLAEGHPLTGPSGIDAIERGMNRVWRMFAAGQVRLTAEAAGIGIVHRFGPGRIDQPMLEGAYGRWFEELGGAGLALRTIARSDDDLTLHYGR